MTAVEPQPASPPPERRPFQFTLRTLLLLCMVLASSMGVFGTWGIGVFVVAVGLAVYGCYAKSLWSLGRAVFGVLCLAFLIGFVLAAESVRSLASPRSECINNLKQIANALHDYHAAKGSFPPAYITDKNGKPMHSWRVLILPYMDCTPLYRSYNFNEPWDGPNNKKLLAACPREYVCPKESDTSSPRRTQTSYIAVVGPNAAWPGEKSRKLGWADFPGGDEHTIMLVEVADSGIAWTEPRDLSLETLETEEDESPALLVSSRHGRYDGFFYTEEGFTGVSVATADGRIYFLPSDHVSVESLRKILRVGAFFEKEHPYPAPSDKPPPGSPHKSRVHLNWPNIAALAVWLLSVGMLLVGAVRSRKPAGKAPAAV